MGKVLLDMAMSLDGFVAGPAGEPEGALHEWWFSGASDGPTGEVIEESLSTTGAFLMGRRTYDAGDNADGFVDNLFRVPHFVLTHRAPERAAKGDTEFIFVTDGVESALEQAAAAAADRKVVVSGGADTAQQFIRAGLLDEVQLHVVPILLGAGIRLFDGLDAVRTRWEGTGVTASAGVTHLRFRVPG